MTSPLFRKEALEHRKDRLYGEVILLQPLSMTVLVGVVAAICAILLIILFWGTYARKETVRGYLIPDKGIVKTYAPSPGTIAKVHVREGDEVQPGQEMISLISERSMTGGGDIDTKLLEELAATKTHYQESIKGEDDLLKSGTIRLKTQINGLQSQLVQVTKRIQNQQSRLEILEKRVAGAKKLLDKKNISEIEYNRFYEELLEQQQRYQDLLTNKVTLQNNLSQAQTELQQLPIKIKAEINEIENRISDINQRIAEVQGRHEIEIRSPIAGTVTALQTREGQFLRTETPLLSILPKDALLQAELFVPSRAIGFIQPGQTVRIRYEAFPYQRFGIYEGKVGIISKHVLFPQELLFPIDLKEPVYRVTVMIAEQGVKAYAKQFPLQAGMLLEADIVLDKRTLFQWILDPVFSLKGRI